MMLLFSALALLLSPLPAPQQTSPAAPPAIQTPAIQAPAEKHDDKLDEVTEPTFGPSHVVLPEADLSFDLPDGIRSRTDLLARINSNSKSKSAAGKPCVQLQLYAFDAISVRRIFLYRYNGECFEQHPLTQDRVRSTSGMLLKNMLHGNGKETMASPMDYTLGTRTAGITTGNVYSQANHGILFGEAMCLPTNLDLTCMVFISSSASKVRRLAALPLTFGKDAPTAAIPEDVSRFNLLPSITFHDDKRHIEYTYPGTFAKAQPRVEAILQTNTDIAEEKDKQALHCMHSLLGADDLEDDSHSNLFVFAIDLQCSHLEPTTATLHGLIEGIGKGYKKRGGKTRKPIAYKIGARDAFLLQGQLRKGDFRGHEMELATVCTVVASDAVCWQFTSNSPEIIRALEQSPVSFDRGLGIPLVAPDLIAAPQ
ncbi:MAG: hypothetical protein PW792_02650 [Acidobacteriaceae bacterium]|nr:hypothetical protein [Acidobacteriaceae bacterium]